MSLIVLTNASSGATRNAGTQGDLTTLLDWALPQKGWAIEYTGTNERVYRPGSGIRNRLYVNHNTAISGNAGLAVVRGCENASSSSVLVDPFPTVAVSSNALSNWLVSNAASTVDRRFRIYLSETFVYYFSNYSGLPDQWDFGFFGDPSPSLTDPYGTVVSIRSSAGTSSSGLTQATSSTVLAGSNIYWARDISGATKSTRGSISCSGTSLGSVAGTPGARGGYQNRIYREKVAVSDGGGASGSPTSLSIARRGWLPNLWGALHLNKGTLSDDDTFTDTAYNPTAEFRLLSSNSSASAIMEETDTWSPP